MKKFFACILSLLLSFSLSACGQTTTQTPDSNTVNPVFPTVPVPTTQEPASLNPEDYFASDGEYDLIGFMNAYGYTYRKHYVDEVKVIFKDKSKDVVIRLVFYSEEYKNPTLIPGNYKIQVAMNDRVYETSGAVMPNEGNTLTFSREALSDFPTILLKKEGIIKALELIPIIQQNTKEGHCPFYGLDKYDHGHYQKVESGTGWIIHTNEPEKYKFLETTECH